MNLRWIIALICALGVATPLSAQQTTVIGVPNLAVTSNTCPANGFYLAGTNNPAVCVNSTQTASWSTTSASALAITFSGDANYFVRNSSTNSAARAVFNLGNGFSATDVQMILNANANVSGNGARSFTIAAGNGMYLQGDAANNSFVIASDKTVALPQITTDATHTDANVCEDTTSHVLYFGSGTLGVCLGTSSARYKRDIVDMTDGLSQIAALAPKNYFYREGYGDSGAREQYGLVAEDVVHVLPKLVHLDQEGKPNSVDLLGMVPILIKAVQELKADNDDLRARLQTVRASR